MRPIARPALLFAAVVGLAAALSACTVFKPESFRVTQPGGVGALHYALALCTEPETLEGEPCEANTREGDTQVMLVFAVPKGATVPATVAAVPGPGAPPITYTRNQEVAERFAALPPAPEETWPPEGSELVGYLSGVFAEKAGNFEWTIDAEIGLPNGAGGGPFGGPVNAAVATGWRLVNPTHPADRSINCEEAEGPESTTQCIRNEKLAAGVSDLKIPATAPVKANLGATAAVPFTLDFASSSAARPSFELSGSTTVPGATVTVLGSPFAPGAPPAGTTRYPATIRTASVKIPPKAKPGAYNVSFAAKLGGAPVVTQTAQLIVVKPKIGFGKLSLDKKKGTATLQVKVFEAGALTASGKGVGKVKRKAKKAKTLKVTIRAKGKAKKALEEAGKAKVKATFKFKPLSGAAVTKSRSITLQKTP